MKRKIGIYIVLIAIVIGAAPYLVGFLVETRFKDVVKVASDLESTNIEVVKYQRGWRTSYAQTRVTFSGKFVDGLHNNFAGSGVDVGPQSISILLTHDIKHGPFIQQKKGDYTDWTFALATIHSSLNEEAKKKLLAVVGEADALTMDSEIKIDGATKAKIIGKELKITENDQEHLLWKGITGDWELSRDFKRLQCNLLMPGFDAIFGDKHVIGEDLVIKSERFKTPEGLWLGTAKVDLKKLQLDVAQKLGFTMAGFAASGVTDTENGMIESSGSVRIEALKFEDQQLGPINYSASVKKIAPGVMKSFMDITKEMDRAPEAQQAQYVDQLLALIPELLKTRPELVIDDFSVHAQQGDIKSSLSFAIGGPDATDFHNPPQLIQSIVANGNFILPKLFYQEIMAAIVEEQAKSMQPQDVNNAANEMINSQIREGVWVENGANLTLVFEFKDSKLTVNGKALDLMKLFFEAKTQASQAAQPTQQQAPGAPMSPPPGVGDAPSAPDSGTSSISAPR